MLVEDHCMKMEGNTEVTLEPSWYSILRREMWALRDYQEDLSTSIVVKYFSFE